VAHIHPLPVFGLKEYLVIGLLKEARPLDELGRPGCSGRDTGAPAAHPLESGSPWGEDKTARDG